MCQTVLLTNDEFYGTQKYFTKFLLQIITYWPIILKTGHCVPAMAARSLELTVLSRKSVCSCVKSKTCWPIESVFCRVFVCLFVCLFVTEEILCIIECI